MHCPSRLLSPKACSFSVVHLFCATPLAQAGDSMAREIVLCLPFQSSKGWPDGPEVAHAPGQMGTTEEESWSDRKRAISRGFDETQRTLAVAL